MAGGGRKGAEKRTAERKAQATLDKPGEMVTLEPGKYWLSTPIGAWSSYSKTLRKAWGDAYKVIRTKDNHDTDSWFFIDENLEFSFVVILVLEPIEINTEIVTHFGEWEPGVSAVSLGLAEQQDPDLLIQAADAVDAAKDAAKDLASFGAPLLFGLGFAALAIAWAVRK